jgi:hypothetical protein
MRFVVLAWFLTRLLVVAVILGAGHPASFANWDGAWYGSIVAHGYEYALDGKQHNVAFFPLLPLLAWPLVRGGAQWPVAAAALANVAFLGALLLLYRAARARYDDTAARWCVAFACLLPPSLFCSVAYPQSLYLLCSVFALAMFDRSRFVAGGIGAALASAASALGVPLVAALVLEGALRRRWPVAVAGAIGFAGIGAFMLYAQVHFGDALAFVHAQRAWRHGFGLDLPAWQATFASLLTLAGIRQNLSMLLVPLGIVAVVIESPRLGRTMTLYALLALAMLAFSGTPFSVDRNAYAVAPVLIAGGAILRRIPPIGYAVLALCALVLVIDAGRFAHFQWVA